MTRLLSRTRGFLNNIAETNSRINAVVALRDPRDILKEAATDSRSALPYAYMIKDNFCTTDLPTTCSSKALENYTSPFESTVTGIIREAGGLIMGKVNMDEFAMGTDNMFSHYGATLNPLFDVPTSPGGSSGGSAAAIAAGYCDVALGSDTGGSVRLPAAYCSVFGFKPTYGLLSRYGLVSYAESLDTVGILSKSIAAVKDTFRVLNCFDPKDPTSLRNDVRAELASVSPPKKKLRVGVLEEAIIDLDESVRRAWQESLEYLAGQGHEIKLVSIPHLKYALHTYFMISPGEASSNLARYDGIRYGYRAATDSDGPEGALYSATRSEGFGPEVQRRILLGTYNLSADEFDVHFRQAQKVRSMIVNEFNTVFASKNPVFSKPGLKCGDIDVLVQPTNRGIAPSLADVKTRDPVENHINDVLTVPANLAGIPAITVPWAPSIGIQVWGQYGDDELVLHTAEELSMVIHSSS